MGVQLPGLGDPEEEAYQWMRQNRGRQVKDERRISTSRFLALGAGCVKHNPSWYFHRFEGCVTACEHSMMGTKAFASKLSIKLENIKDDEKVFLRKL